MQEITMSRKTRYYLGAVAAVVIAGSLLTLTPHEAEAAFPGKNGKIAFQSNRDGNEEIYSMDPDGSNQTRLTINFAEDEEPAVSPDGTKIAFRSNRAADTDPNDFDIFVMNSDGSGAPILLTTSTAFEGAPSFSPDGTKITFVSFRDGNGEIYVMDTDPNTNDATRLTNDSAPDSQPAFSPDGKKIAFRSFRNGNSEIYVMNADGTSPTRLTNNLATDEQPSFSPNGTKIAFQRNGEIYKMNVDGTGQKKLTKNAAADIEPAFSPDGKKISFVSTRNGNLEVYVMNAKDGSRQKRLTNSPKTDTVPDWGVAT